MPLYKLIGNKILTRWENAMAGTDLSEWHSGYRAYSVSALQKLTLQRNSDGFDFDTQIIIPPLLEYVATLRLPNYTAFEGYYLRLTIEGSGAIIAPKTTF